MKMTMKDFIEMKEACEKVIKDNPGIQEEYRKQGLSNMRFRWDVLWVSTFQTSSVYHYLNDDHIDTALRMITKTK